MASSKQVVAIVDDVMKINPSGRYHADFLRAAGVLPSTPGRPDPLAPEHIALLLISVLLGEPCAGDTPDRVREYAAMHIGQGGPTFGDILARHIDNPHDLFELRMDIDAPGATITFRQADHGVATIVFHADRVHPRPAFERFAIIDGGLLVRLATAIQNAPEVRAGRRRRSRKFTGPNI